MGSSILAIFVGLLLVAAKLFLRPEKRPPVPREDDRER